MGIPYSKEINRAFEELNNAYGQITPLIEAAYEVLETTKNISLILAAIQVLTVVLLALVLLALVGLLIALDPAMQTERDELVTPTLRWITGWMAATNLGLGWFGWVAILFGLLIVGMWAMTTRSGRWVRRKVQESAQRGQERLEQQREKAKKKKQKQKKSKDNETKETEKSGDASEEEGSGD